MKIWWLRREALELNSICIRRLDGCRGCTILMAPRSTFRPRDARPQVLPVSKYSLNLAARNAHCPTSRNAPAGSSDICSQRTPCCMPAQLGTTSLLMTRISGYPPVASRGQGKNRLASLGLRPVRNSMAFQRGVVLGKHGSAGLWSD